MDQDLGPGLTRLAALLAGLALAGGLAAAPRVGHQLEVALTPDQGRLEVRDRIELPEGPGPWVLELHSDLNPRLRDPAGDLTPLGRQGDRERFRLRLPAGVRQASLSYAGVIQHPLEDLGTDLGRGEQRSRGHIGPTGVFLDGASGWYPWLAGSLQSFRLEVRVPPGWLAVSQGRGPGETAPIIWEETQPQDDIYLLAAPFHLYRRSADPQAQVYLRAPDPELAARYLDATGHYLDLYSRLLGPYPYAKFALVENFWESGYGMPSFTLLGPRVIRLPFILHTSYPHEILHNWWGNGVYIDPASGNWSEGLTTYLADYLLKEEAGQGVETRRAALQRYGDQVASGQDAPLQAFRARHGGASQSLGYDKGMMFFHMLRRELGDGPFLAGLRRFYQEQRFQMAGSAELQQAFQAISGPDLGPFFRQWLERAGAPSLALEQVAVTPEGSGFRVSGRVRQTQAAPPFRLQVPLRLHSAEGGPLAETLVLTGREQTFRLFSATRPQRLEVDPGFDLFRRLHREEAPPALSALFGAQQGLLILPSAAPADLFQGYRALAQGWTTRTPGWEIREDQELDELPGDRPVWVLGWENRFMGWVRDRLAGSGVVLDPEHPTLTREVAPGPDPSLALVVPGDPPVGWLGTHNPKALPGLARKLPHYGASGRLLFTGDGPELARKDPWPRGDSPLSLALEPGTSPGPPPLERSLLRQID